MAYPYSQIIKAPPSTPIKVIPTLIHPLNPPPVPTASFIAPPLCVLVELAVVLLAGLVKVALPLEEDGVDDGVGKESDSDVLARLQNCCESCSAEES